MKKYRWSLKKTKEFLKSRSLGTEMKMGFSHQLMSHEKRMKVECKVTRLDQDWSESCMPEDADELVIRNTFVNVRDLADSLGFPPARDKDDTQHVGIVRRPSWADVDGGRQLEEAQEAEEPKSPLSMMLGSAKETLKPIVPPRGPLISALKGAQKPTPSVAVAAELEPATVCDGSPAADATVVSIQTRSSLVQCRATEIVPKRFGLKLRSSSIILEYEVPSHSLRAHHVIKVSLSNLCDKSIARDLQERHPHWLEGVQNDQLIELVGRLRRGQSVVGGS
jgi:hypothetical protein